MEEKKKETDFTEPYTYVLLYLKKVKKEPNV